MKTWGRNRSARRWASLAVLGAAGVCAAVAALSVDEGSFSDRVSALETAPAEATSSEQACWTEAVADRMPSDRARTVPDRTVHERGEKVLLRHFLKSNEQGCAIPSQRLLTIASEAGRIVFSVSTVIDCVPNPCRMSAQGETLQDEWQQLEFLPEGSRIVPAGKYVATTSFLASTGEVLFTTDAPIELAPVR